MPGYFSYIGPLDSPGFFWNDIPDEKFRTGNTPNKIIPAGFSFGLGFAPGVLDQWNKKAGLEVKQIDWGAWGMIVRKSDIETIWKSEKNGRPWLNEKEWLDIWRQIGTLQDDQKYVLVVAEEP
jgi:hypothetical protein